jgi:hypothetical protein
MHDWLSELNEALANWQSRPAERSPIIEVWLDERNGYGWRKYEDIDASEYK